MPKVLQGHCTADSTLAVIQFPAMLVCQAQPGLAMTDCIASRSLRLRPAELQVHQTFKSQLRVFKQQQFGLTCT